MSDENKNKSFGSEVGSGIGCLLFVVAILLLFDLGGFRSAAIHWLFR